jgi:hypothetical protein
LTTPIRTLEGITYWVVDDPEDIFDFMNTHVRKEWVGDTSDEGRRVEDDSWLQTLAQRRWSLEVLGLDKIKLNPYEFVPRTGYNFEEKLVRRSKELRKSIENYGSVIWPITVRGEDMQLIDGHCRFMTLRDLKVPRIYAYVGRLNDLG